MFSQAHGAGREEGGTIEVRRRGFDCADNDSGDDAVLNDELVQVACLPVSGAPLPPSEEPAKDADEYLRRVQWERLHCPEIVTADVEERPPRQSKRKDRGRTGSSRYGSYLSRFLEAAEPEELPFSAAWAEDVAEAFSALRTRCAEARDALSVPGAGAEPCPAAFTFDAWRVRVSQGPPSTAVLSSQELLSMNRLMVAVTDALCADGAGAEEEAQGDGADTAAAPPCASGPVLAEWAFAALAFLEEPLQDDTAWQLQRLRRHFKKTMTAISDQAPSEKASELQSSEQVQAALLFVIVGEVFNQR